MTFVILSKTLPGSILLKHKHIENSLWHFQLLELIIILNVTDRLRQRRGSTELQIVTIEFSVTNPIIHYRYNLLV